MARQINHPALQPLKLQFPGVRFLVGEFRDMVTVVVPREHLLEVCTFLRDDPNLRYDMLCELNGVDYLGYPGAKDRFGVTYGLVAVDQGTPRLWLKVFLNPQHSTEPGSKWNQFSDEVVMEQGDPGLKIDSVTGVWPAAEWLEREVYDMLGIIFMGHPDLRRIMTWNGFGNYPLRKDYPLRGVGERDDYKIVTRDSA